MPLYGYRCTACGHELEVLQKVSAPSPVDCPACQQATLQKKLSAAGFQLKGTGWYVTDFRGGKGPTSEPAIKPEGESKSVSSDKNEAASVKSDSAAVSESNATTSTNGSGESAPSATPKNSPSPSTPASA